MQDNTICTYRDNKSKPAPRGRTGEIIRMQGYYVGNIINTFHSNSKSFTSGRALKCQALTCVVALFCIIW